jgi:hypothetical protein
MKMTRRVVLGWLGAIGLTVVGTGTLIVLNWEDVSRNLGEALDTRAQRIQATLFRWGEVMSIGAALKVEYGAEPDVAYDTDTGDRILSIAFSDYPLPDNVTTTGHAREIAAFAVGKTTKFEQIDMVTVLFRTSLKEGVVESTVGAESYSFALDDLMPNQPQTESAEDDSAAE